MNGGQRPDFGGQGAILGPPSHIKRDFAVPLLCNCQFFLEVHINQFLIYMLINPAPQQIQNLGEGLFHKSQQMSLRTLKMQIQLLLIHYYKYTKLKFNQAKYSRFCLS